MRKIILNLCTSLDFFIEGSKGEYDWCFTDQDYGMTEFLDSIDTILIGRKSYDQSLENMPNGFPGKKMIVCTTHPESVGKDVSIISENIEENIQALLQKSGKNIWLFGGAKLASEMLKLNLIDVLMIAVHPLLLGEGKSLFFGLDSRIKLKLTDNKTYDSGLVQLFYDVIK